MTVHSMIITLTILIMYIFDILIIKISNSSNKQFMNLRYYKVSYSLIVYEFIPSHCVISSYALQSSLLWILNGLNFLVRTIPTEVDIRNRVP